MVEKFIILIKSYKFMQNQHNDLLFYIFSSLIIQAIQYSFFILKLITSLWTVITDYFLYFQTMDIFTIYLDRYQNSSCTLSCCLLINPWNVTLWLAFQRGIFVQILQGEWLKVNKIKKKEGDREYLIIMRRTFFERKNASGYGKGPLLTHLINMFIASPTSVYRLSGSSDVTAVFLTSR